MRTLILTIALMNMVPAFAAGDLTVDDSRGSGFITRKPSALEVAEQKRAAAPIPKQPLKPEIADNLTEATVCAIDCAQGFHSTQPLHAGLQKIPASALPK